MIRVKATAISPEPFNVGKVRSEMAKALMDEGKYDRTKLNKTVEGWSEPPAIAWESKIDANVAWVWIGPKGSERLVSKWIRIDEGLDEHDIISATWMVFPWQGRGVSYDAKTTPGQFSSSGPGTKKGPIRRTKHVRGHYITARQWSQTLADERIGPFAEAIQAAIDRGLI